MKDREALAAAFLSAAQRLEDAAAAAADAHAAYTRLCRQDQDDLDEQRLVADQVLGRRVDVGLYAVGQLVEHLCEESRQAHARYPGVDAEGNRLRPPAPVGNPAALLRWWQDLTDDDRTHLIKSRPGWVGSADGLPVWARHAANLVELDAEISRRAYLLGLEDRVLDATGVREHSDLRGLVKLRALLGDDPYTKGLEGISTPRKERYLYLIDADSYPLKAAVVLGDLERAEIVVLHVPGATSTVDLRLFREATWMSNLRVEIGRLAGGQEKVAIVDWIGYQAPFDIAARRSLGDSGVSVLVPGEATEDKYAREAAPKLAACAEGLRALVGGTVRLVASGHSYGASVMGLALQQTGVFDVAAVTGCPGLFASEMSQFKLPQRALYAAIAPGDLIGMLNLFGVQVAQIPGIQLLNPLPRATSYPDGSRALLLPPVGHESYYNANTASLNSLAAVAVGDVDRIKTIGIGRFSALRGVVNAVPVVGNSGAAG